MKQEIIGSNGKCPNCGVHAIPMWKRIWHSSQNPIKCRSCGKELYPVGNSVYLMDIPMLIAFLIGYAIALITKEVIYFFPIFYFGVVITTYLQHKKVSLKIEN